MGTFHSWVGVSFLLEFFLLVNRKNKIICTIVKTVKTVKTVRSKNGLLSTSISNPANVVLVFLELWFIPSWVNIKCGTFLRQSRPYQDKRTYHYSEQHVTSLHRPFLLPIVIKVGQKSFTLFTGFWKNRKSLKIEKP